MIRTFSLTCLSLTAMAAEPLAFAQPIADGAVLQRDMPLALWGRVPAGAVVQVTLAEVKGTATADASGGWRLQLPAQPAGGPLVLTATAGSERIEVKNVVLGEVWYCAGQSNMGMTLDQAEGGAEAIRAGDQRIRFYDVLPWLGARAQVAGSWRPATPEHAGACSAVSFFAARRLAEELKVTVGLVVASWGSSPAEGWAAAPGHRS